MFILIDRHKLGILAAFSAYIVVFIFLEIITYQTYFPIQPINDLPKEIRKVFSHMGRQEEMKEGELTEKCWAGYTQKGMKTMFGKRYPNCVKKTK